MAIQGIYESTLSTSEIFNGINNVDGSTSITQKAMNLIKTAKYISNTDIEGAYIAVRQITDTLTREAVKAFDNGTTVLLYNTTPSASVSQAVPFMTFLSKSQNKYITYVFVDKYITVSRDNVMNIQSPVLRDLLIGAIISNKLKTNYQMIASNDYMQKTLMNLYTKFIMRIINRQFAISPDKIAWDILVYWINRFFLNIVLGANNTPENIENMAKSDFKYIDELKYDEIKQTYDIANPQKISQLLDLLKTVSVRMKSLYLGSFLSDWFNYYYYPAALAPDTLEYLIFMIILLLSGNNIISIAASDIVKEQKGIKTFRVELLKLI